ncbi:MAG: hypothetical protein L6U16_12885 [Porphyromonadaceae bacterium]|nr:MAG: hypothetical protein L6U16_12885 [Porphyromonadaceae bacterium]
MKRFAVILICVLAWCGTFGRTKTSVHKLSSTRMELECITTDADSVPEGVNPNAISIKGYTKKRERQQGGVFFVTNRTDRTISQIKLRLRYSTLTGEQLHERVATVNVTLRAGETRLVTIKSWDIQRQFYYYAGAKPRKKASPYKVAYRLIGYSLPIGE